MSIAGAMLVLIELALLAVFGSFPGPCSIALADDGFQLYWATGYSSPFMYPTTDTS